MELDFLLRFPFKAGVTSPVDFLQHQGWGGIKVGLQPQDLCGALCTVLRGEGGPGCRALRPKEGHGKQGDGRRCPESSALLFGCDIR